MKDRVSQLLITSVLFAASLTAQATIVTFSNEARFLAFTAATNATGPIPNVGHPIDPTLGSITFSTTSIPGDIPSGGIWFGTAGGPPVPGDDWTSLNPGNDIAIDGVENLNMQVKSPVYSLGVRFVEPQKGFCAFTCVDSTFTVNIKNDNEVVGSFRFNAPNDALSFLGIWSDREFNRVEIREPATQIINIDDEFFGEVFTGVKPAILPRVSGCEQVRGRPVVNSKIVLQQPLELGKTTGTDAMGCYQFYNVVSGKPYTVTVNGPVVP